MGAAGLSAGWCSFGGFFGFGGRASSVLCGSSPGPVRFGSFLGTACSGRVGNRSGSFLGTACSGRVGRYIFIIVEVSERTAVNFDTSSILRSRIPAPGPSASSELQLVGPRLSCVLVPKELNPIHL